ncbi:MAG: hypothetical protein IAF08_09370 [Rhizobacter sp.]|nr:hypothetical protein [Chlorobiales bacterium]
MAFIIPQRSLAQLSIDNSTSAAMGSTGAAFTNGFPALGINPARLTHFEHPDRRLRGTVAFAPFGVSASSNALSISLYNLIFGTEGKVFTEAQKQEIFNSFADVTRASNETAVTSLGISLNYADLGIGSFAFSIRDDAGANFGLNKDYLALLLFGNESFAGRRMQISDTQADAWWNRSYTVSFARFTPEPRFAKGIKKFAVGASVRLVHSFGYAGTERNSSKVFTSLSGDSVSVEANYRLLSSVSENFQSEQSFTPLASPAGTGFGADVGISGEFDKGIAFGAALCDLGAVHYTADATIKERNGLITFTGFNDLLTDGKVQAQLDSLRGLIEESSRKESFTVGLPARFRFGVAVRFDEWLEQSVPVAVSLDYVQGFNEVYGNSLAPLVGVGFESRHWPGVPLRTGLRFGGAQGFGWSLGVGLDTPYFAADFSTRNVESIFRGQSATAISFGLSMRLRFDRLREVD